jgi:hypothetical protein
MTNNLPLFKKIEITKKNGSISSISDASILLTGDFLIIIKKDYSNTNYLNYEQHDVYNLNDIKYYKVK